MYSATEETIIIYDNTQLKIFLTDYTTNGEYSEMPPSVESGLHNEW